ncbi:tetratricopeptide repeat protein [Geobacter pelophilus]|uniref:Tetratricopeptide repeat protein n=1 Tax=Geoanaerobacter pelophilus TaxID=60036 RepID=A0AAW4L172_9BACT|nr:tetratricopeptide repeat protein [Geoanaerobacter pelophilus]MBT0663917.1 tetratricopeptide repeat protein [Geoanaerobacter pelophilus]
MATTSDNGTSLFLAILPTAETQQAQRASLANNQLIAGVRMLQKSRPDEAIKFFKKAVALDSSNVDAYTYLGNTYLSQKKNKEAIDTYKKLVAMKPFDKDAAVNLGNAYAQDKKYADAEKSYKKAVSISPNDKLAHYSLGQTYLLQNKLKDAETEFLKVSRIAPRDANGFYALGQTYNKMGKFDAAITNLKQALSLKHENFTLAETELGYAYAGKGDDYNLERQITKLKKIDSTAALELQAATLKPKFTNVSAGSYDPFLPTLGPNTTLEMLTATDPKHTLSQANASKTFTMDFQFNSDMDPVSVQSLANWQIRKANGGAAGYYNYGYTPNPQKEANLPIIKSVAYNVTSRLATVTFSLKQNADVSAVIDPSHLVFKFSGKNIDGKAMDSTGDEFDGFAGKPF